MSDDKFRQQERDTPNSRHDQTIHVDVTKLRCKSFTVLHDVDCQLVTWSDHSKEKTGSKTDAWINTTNAFRDMTLLASTNWKQGNHNAMKISQDTKHCVRGTRHEKDESANGTANATELVNYLVVAYKSWRKHNFLKFEKHSKTLNISHYGCRGTNSSRNAPITFLGCFPMCLLPVSCCDDDKMKSRRPRPLLRPSKRSTRGTVAASPFSAGGHAPLGPPAPLAPLAPPTRRSRWFRPSRSSQSFPLQRFEHCYEHHRPPHHQQHSQQTHANHCAKSLAVTSAQPNHMAQEDSCHPYLFVFSSCLGTDATDATITLHIVVRFLLGSSTTYLLSNSIYSLIHGKVKCGFYTC